MGTRRVARLAGRLGAAARRRPGAAALGVALVALLSLGLLAAAPLHSVCQLAVPVLDSAGEPTGLTEEAVPLAGLDFVTILVVGIDSVRHVDLEPAEDTRFADIPLEKVRGRADTIVVVGLDRRTGTARILRIPRDSIVDLGERGPDKIAHCLAYYPFSRLKRAAENLLQIPIHRYVLVDFEGLKAMVDAIGGVTVTIDHDLSSPDGVWLPQGTHHLDGELALRFVRHRYGENRAALARVDLQHIFLTAAVRQVQAGGPLRILTAYRQAPNLLKTNLSPADLSGLAREWHDLDPATIGQLALPGVPEEHSWRLDPAGVYRTVREFWPDGVSEVPWPEPPVGRVDRAAWARSRWHTELGLWPFLRTAASELCPGSVQTWWRLGYYPFLRDKSGMPSPPVLIYHTHATESFMPELFPDPAARAAHSVNDDSFTADPDKSVVRVGREAASALADLGFNALHVTVVHDPGGQRGRTGAYTRARETARAAVAGLGHPVLVLDIHRDAVTTRTTLGGRPAAGILLVVARQNPWWQWNYTFARNLSARLEALAPGLSRGVRLLDGRYNQDLSPLALVVEVGGAESTLEECLVSARALAGVLADYAGGP